MWRQTGPGGNTVGTTTTTTQAAAAPAAAPQPQQQQQRQQQWNYDKHLALGAAEGRAMEAGPLSAALPAVGCVTVSYTHDESRQGHGTPGRVRTVQVVRALHR